eukprot:CAMPEP_0197455004 /NCGR_PEP_ID=MMETSP1175-20131217/39600_1 /TAXON_ID=1003142 /ORGANISM="Triceratium dubium, Strain CCMP147" /LENGTH=403 /DNA_ID=CAMNT_0042988739 /DNA_START=104 /DNA_END=1315 /DNA_ORIENTATION=+
MLRKVQGDSPPDARSKVLPRHARRRSSFARLQEAIFLRSESVDSLGTHGDKQCGRRVKEIDRRDLLVGKLLGKGSFNHIFEVKEVRRESLLDGVETKDCDHSPGSEQGTKLVVKYLRPSLRKDRVKFCAAAADLALEAKILSSIKHPNIIRLHGVTQGCTASAFLSKGDNSGGYFLLLDKLERTLEQRIVQWSEERNIVEKGTGKLAHVRALFTPKKSDYNGVNDFLLRRLLVALEVAEGMKYLHGCNILYRDLKPANIGFDSFGKTKIFDFGLATIIDQRTQNFPKGACGTPLYMAPEVARNCKYDFSADVYSYGILFWEIFTLDQPFKKFTQQDMQDKVVYGTVRPKISKSRWPSELRDIVVRCWSADPSERKSFCEVVRILKEQLGTYAKCDTFSSFRSL